MESMSLIDSQPASVPGEAKRADHTADADTPTVSVVTAVYNGEPYFDRAVPSILGQAYEDFEWIIVDDGSTDATLSRLGELAGRDSRVRILTPGRIGRSEALNLGVGEARGPYVAIQDFDDTSSPDRLSLQVMHLDAHPEIGVVGGYCLLVDENRNERYVRQPPTAHRDIIRAMARNIPLAHTIATFRKAAWEEAGGYPLVDDIEDLRLWIRMASLGWRFANVPEIIGEHFVHAASYWHTAFRYRSRQRVLARVQRRAIHELDLPLWFHIYPIGRSFYWLLPDGLKRIVRRSLGGSREKPA
jgi:glycosyltransferase involved in cell wall biosynthesis